MVIICKFFNMKFQVSGVGANNRDFMEAEAALFDDD